MKKHNFNAGPCILPEVALQNTAKAVIDLDGIGMSVLTISHRSKEFEAIMDETKALWRELLHIPDNYHILFLGGGASLQFCMVPYNLLQKKAVYLETGVWAKKALQEAKIFGDATALASSADKNFSYNPKGFKIPTDVDYFHVTTNNTIYGTELKEDIDSPVTLVADMSSDIMSRPVDIKKYGLIYGGAQKNVGPAGVTFVIIREDILGKVDRKIPTMLDYRTHIKEDSMFNTPPCGAIFTMRETLKWVKSIGGVEKINELNKKKAQLLYDAIDSSKMFVGTVEKDSRSIMNICFVMKPEYKDKEDAFMDFAKKSRYGWN